MPGRSSRRVAIKRSLLRGTAGLFALLDRVSPRCREFLSLHDWLSWVWGANNSQERRWGRLSWVAAWPWQGWGWNGFDAVFSWRKLLLNSFREIAQGVGLTAWAMVRVATLTLPTPWMRRSIYRSRDFASRTWSGKPTLPKDNCRFTSKIEWPEALLCYWTQCRSSSIWLARWCCSSESLSAGPQTHHQFSLSRGLNR
jgi:hypothetical protein